MGKYILTRLLKAAISLFCVVSIVIAMIFTLIPRTKVLDLDNGYKKMTGDNKTVYKYNRFKDLGYLKFERITEMCKNESEDYDACVIAGSSENERVIALYQDKGYTIEYLKSGAAYAYRDNNIFELVGNYWANLLVIDHPWKVQDANNPDLERKYYVGLDHNNRPAIMCSGCTYKYQVYFNGSFPFIHSNTIKLNFGLSYPTKVGIPTLDVIGTGQGEQKKTVQTFPTGLEKESALNLYTAQYKSTLDHLDEQMFTDHYATCDSYYSSPSMIQTSLIFGLISIILAYCTAIPLGILMARKKDGIVDKLGIAYINIVIAMPSLALIFFIRQIATNLGMPDKFPLLGFNDVRSYITPILILTILNMPSLMTWTRRYMVDQSNSDYVKFAKAKGLSQKEIFSRHIMKNALIPIVNGIPQSVVACISGALITESAFAIPGMGKMLPDAIKQMNNNMVVTLVFIFASFAMIAVIVGDVLMTIVDPRIQLANKKYYSGKTKRGEADAKQ